MAEKTVAQNVTHTPGPWINEDGLVYAEPIDQIVMVKNSADGTERPHHTGLTALVYGHHLGHDGHYTHDANARLIAAAPDLLAACRLALVRLDDGTEVSAKIAAHVLAAIEKADGAL